MFSRRNSKKEKSGTSSSTYAEKSSVKKNSDGSITTVFHRSTSQTTFTSTVKEEKSVFSTEFKSPSLLGTSTFLTNNNSVPPSSGQVDVSRRSNNTPRLSLPGSTTPRTPTHRGAFGGITLGTYPSKNDASPMVSSVVPRSTTPSHVVHANSDPNISCMIPTYPNKCPKGGRVLLINNIKFINQNTEERKGAEKDHKDVKKLFKELNFDIVDFTNLTCSGMLEEIRKFRNSSFRNYDMSIVIMMSHGNNRASDGTAIRGGYTQIYGVDDVGLSIDSILDEFSPQLAKELIGKPKIFIFQCCRGKADEDHISTDVGPTKSVVKHHADVLVAYSTLPGFASNRNEVNGTWYIQSICEIFRKHHKDFHIEEMLRLVDDALSKKHPDYKQTSMFENRGFKRCYLYRKVS